MNQLNILGSAELRTHDGKLEHSFLAGPKRLFLLSFLLINKTTGFQRRDRILPLLWPEKGQKSARNALSNMLYHLRKTLGKNCIETRGTEELRVNNELFECDVFTFENAIENNDWEKALNLYRGRLLEGLHIPKASAELDQWLDTHRNHYHNEYLKAAEKAAQQFESSQQYREAVKYRKILYREDPFSIKKVKDLLRSLMYQDKQSEISEIINSHAKQMAKEFGENPSAIKKELSEFIEQSKPEIEKKKKYLKATHENSVAVLPFDVLGNHESTLHFARGLHNDLLTRLSANRQLSVISRTSVLRYEDSNQAIPEIARELGVRIIVEGSVQQIENRIRLNIQMIEAETDDHLWAETFDRELTTKNIFDIQSELAGRITDSLEGRFTKETTDQPKTEPTQNLDAYLLYTKGRFHLSQRSEVGISQAISYFRGAIDEDKDYAQAWTGLAEAQILAEWYNYPQESTQTDAMESAVKALSLNPKLGEAHTALGIIYVRRQNGPDALREFKTSVELQPGYAEGHNWLGWMNMVLGRIDQSIEPAEKAVTLDPHSPYTRVYLGQIYLANAHPENALKEVETAKKIEPDFGVIHFIEGLTLYHLGRYQEAEHAQKKALTLLTPESSPSSSEVIASLAIIHNKKGRKNRAQELIKKVLQTDDYASAGFAYAALGEHDKAFDAFDKVKQWGAFTTPTIRYLYPDFLSEIRKDNRFEKVLSNVNSSWDIT
ncbi:tetratricopeptide repeat protein [Rhodohalobacter sulfatireducens]|uniref:Tetratricopeptide repeat protein n=1 Tax=Rhodohalobacter sulfatireducens TaxID=2911366 RepID=A0ABS9KCV5_9BACT|nr:tetratricopeptide repeat protein [Rhodohalobacter sulfatireducens]MCG2588660.1 tetratricopeptide repeat protein [Rhodohalobacter sulfatireducens]